MPRCQTCGEENSERARFCQRCGISLVPGEARGESRRIVTILFSDVAESTRLTGRLDPESTRRIFTRYFEEMRRVVERHGGTVEKFIGDAVMAVFGLPGLHEDDPLRAVRAAWEMHEALDELNEGLKGEFDVEIQIRTGVNTGEVVAGDPRAREPFVTGEAVNLAARLQQAASAGEVLIADSTYRLVRDAVAAEERELGSLRGIAGRVRAHRLLGVVPGAAGHVRRFDAPMVDREREQALLREAFKRAVAELRCQLVTIAGAAGVGKSRLVDEFLRWTGEGATALRGRCLPYGEGITFSPVMEIVGEAAGLSKADPPEVVRRKIAALLDGVDQGALAAERVAQALGLSGGAAPPDEVLWAIRILLETLARSRPLVVEMDDVQWAEPTLLELIEHVAYWSRDTPIMLVCLARPELQELRPSWGSAGLDAQTIQLEPLADDDSDVLIRNLLGSAELAEGLRHRIVEVAGGNPLFAEEIVSMLVDDGVLIRQGGRWATTADLSRLPLPPTISSLIAARLDRMTEAERGVASCAAVIGKDFSMGAVAAIERPELRGEVPTHLLALVRKGFVLPAQAGVPGANPLSFRHLLIHDAVYDSLPKALRADLHERYGSWLETWAGDRIEEHEEIVGYHLEQAHRYRRELGLAAEGFDSLALRAGKRLASAGRRASERGDMPATANLLGRAVVLLPVDDPDRLACLPALAESLSQTGDLAGTEAVLTEMHELARAAGDRSGEAMALLRHSMVRFLTNPKATDVEHLRAIAEESVRTFEELEEAGNLAAALFELGTTYWLTGDLSLMLEAAERALELSLEPGDWLTLSKSAYYIGRAVVLGTTSCEEALERMERLVEDVSAQRMAAACGRLDLATILAMLGRFEEARVHLADARSVFQDLGQGRWLVAAAITSGVVDWWEGDLRAAEAQIRFGYDLFHERGDAENAALTAEDLARVCYELGQMEEAAALAEEIKGVMGEYDLEPQIEWRSVLAKVLVRRGELEEAERLGLEALRLVKATEFVNLRGIVLLDLAEILRLCGRTDEAVRARAAAIDTFEAKGNLVWLERARAWVVGQTD